MLTLTLIALLGAAPLLGACNTTAGAGKDISKVGDKIEKEAVANTPRPVDISTVKHVGADEGPRRGRNWLHIEANKGGCGISHAPYAAALPALIATRETRFLQVPSSTSLA